MRDVHDDSVCEYVNYVGCDPDCVERTVPEGGDDYPVGTLLSEPLCVITDDMTYQEKIEALSGTIYDYDDVCDNRPDYFDYDDPCDYEECMVSMVWRKMECVMILTDRMFLVMGLSSTELELMTSQLGLCPYRKTDCH